jgi:hypothetical protein
MCSLLPALMSLRIDLLTASSPPAAQVTDLGVASRVCRRDVDAVLVHVQADVSDRFLDGPSPREFATT